MIKKEYRINAPVSEVWLALTNPKYIDNWGGGPAKMSAKQNSKFSLWGGDIWGINTEVTESKKITQDWYGGDWPAPSRLTFTLKAKDGMTDLTLTQTRVPSGEQVDIDNGWDEYYLGPLKKYLESK